MSTLTLPNLRAETNGIHHKNGKHRLAGLSVYRVEISGKSSISDAAGAALRSQLPLIGIPGVTDIHVSSLYEVTGRLSPSQLTTAAQHLLADPITQDFHINNNGHPLSHGGPAKKNWRIEVWLKPSVYDVVGESVRKAIGDLNLPTPETVRCGTAYRFIGRLNQNQAEKIAARLLANPVIHRCSVSPC